MMPTKWPFGKLIAVHPKMNGFVRVVSNTWNQHVLETNGQVALLNADSES